MKRCIGMLVVVAALAAGATRVYDVELSQNDNATTPKGPDGWVGQTWVATCDSVQWCAAFIGRPDTGSYVFRIFDATGSRGVSSEIQVPATDKQYQYVTATFAPACTVTKGVKYMLKVWHSRGDSVNFYFNRSDPYDYGRMVLPSGADTIIDADLAARVEGVNWVGKDMLSANSHLKYKWEWDDSLRNRATLDSAQDVGLRYLRDDGTVWSCVQDDNGGPIDLTHVQATVCSCAARGIKLMAHLKNTPRFASSAPTKEKFWCRPPRHLYSPVCTLSGQDTTINSNNYFGFYVYRMVRRFGPKGTFWDNDSFGSISDSFAIRHWEVWNEPNDTTHWNYPDSEYVITPGDTISLCTLYVRACRVADSAMRYALKIGGAPDTSAKLFVGSLGGITHAQYSGNMRGDNYLRTFYDHGGDEIDAHVSAHPYQHPLVTGHRFFDSLFAQDIDTVRAIMGRYGKAGKEILVTEIGWRTMQGCASMPGQANALVKFFASAVGSADHIGGPYTRCFWYDVINDGPDTSTNGESHFGLFKRKFVSPEALEPKPSRYAARQLHDRLSGLELNRRVSTRSASKDDSVTLFEFNNASTGKRTWVCWQKSEFSGGDLTTVKLPTIVNNLHKVKMACAASVESTALSADANYGYVEVDLDSHVVYIRETSDTSRPDMIVDSIWTSPNPPQVNNPVRVHARIKNTGSDSTKPGIADSVIFYVDGVKKAWVVYDSAIHENSSVTVFRDSVWTPDTTRPYLVKVTVNGSRVFMELSFDNNAKYRMYDISYLPPSGSVKINADESFTNTHFGVLHLDSYNPNKADSAYADYMRITQYAVAGAETTEYSSLWMNFDPHFRWRLCQNQGKNVIFAQFKIDEGNLTSEVYKDSILVDWTYPETLKMVINHDSLFTSDTTCTLCCHAVDLSSGICQVRFGNDSLVNLVKDGNMSDTSRWLWNHATYHDSLDLFEMEIQDDSCYLYQQIQKDSILAKDPNCYNGDTLQISGDLVLDHLNASARLEARLIFRLSGPGMDSVLGVVPYGASIDLPDTTLSRTARYNFYSQFAFKPESTGYDFKRIEIGIFAPNTQGTTDTGKIYVDNIRLEPVKPKHAFSPFVGFDTTKLWCLDSVNNKQVVFAQYQDSAGNETGLAWDSITVDTVKPSCEILSPYDSQTVSSTITITGHAHDGIVDPPHFRKYNLDYWPDSVGSWFPVKPDSMSTTPVYPVLIGMPDSLGHWWTDSVTNGHYDLRVLVRDSANNLVEDVVYGVYVSNAEPPGGGGDGFGGFGGEAEAMSLDKDDNLYLVSTESPADQIDLRIRKYSPTGESLLCFSAKLATDSTKTPWPSAIVVDDSSRILVLDGLNNCLKVFDKTGKFLIKVGSRGSGQGQFINPSDLKWNSPGKTKLFIADRGNRRVQVLSKQGSFLRQFGTDSIPLTNPIALVHNTYNQTCVLDAKNDTGRLFVYDSTGKLKRTITSHNLQNPKALALDTKDNLFITDAGNKRILELSPNLTHIYSFGIEGDSFGQFRNPTALAVTKDCRYLYVYDRTKKTISKFTMIKSKKRGGGGGQSEELLEILPTQLLLYAPKPNPAKRLVSLKYAVPRQEKVSLVIYDIVGRQARTIIDKVHKPGFYSATWDGKDARGNELAAGVYFCLLRDDEKVQTRKAVLVK